MPTSAWSTTAASNGATLGIDIAENCAAANINNALREMMAQLKTKLDAIDTSLSGLSSTSLTNLGAVTNVADKIPYMTGSNGWSTKDISYLLPVGSVLPFARSSAPVGFLECDGAAVSRATYSALFGIIGTTFGAGDASTTFNVPDLRAEFVRGWDHGRGEDSGRAFGTAQADELEAHTHTFPVSDNDTNNGSKADGTTTSSTSGTVTTSSTGGTETRPRNIALMYCVKF